MNTPRCATVLVHAPENVTDQQIADALWSVLKGACRPRDAARTYPDGSTLEVHVTTVTAEQDSVLRQEIGGGHD